MAASRGRAICMTDIITFEEQWIQRVTDGQSQMIHRVRIQGMTHWEEITESEEDWLERRRIAELNEYRARRP